MRIKYADVGRARSAPLPHPPGATIRRRRRVAVIDLFRTGDEVLRLLDGVDVVAHNAAFELSFLEAAGVALGEVHCTFQAARLTLGGYSPSLAEAVKAHLGLELDKSEQARIGPRPSSAGRSSSTPPATPSWSSVSPQRILPALGDADERL